MSSEQSNALDLPEPDTEETAREVKASFLAAMLGSRKAMLAVCIVGLITLCALLSPFIAPFDPNAQSLGGRLLAPLSYSASGSFHLFGTDQLGRDIASRVVYGARVSLLVGIAASLVAGTLGVTFGLVSGYFGGWVDAVIMRMCDIQLALPYILLAIAVLAIVGSGLLNIILVLSVTQWVTYARVVRSGVLSEKQKEYVLAAKALGFGNTRIIARYILPNVLAPVIVVGTFSIAQTIIAESALSFLGLGLSTSIPTWGSMLADGRSYIVVAWWLAAIPGLVITITVIGINLFGDWLRDHLDPKLSL